MDDSGGARRFFLSFPFFLCGSPPGRGTRSPHPVDVPPEGCGQARSDLHCRGGATATNRPPHPVQAPARTAPVSGGGPERKSAQSLRGWNAPAGHLGPGPPAGERAQSLVPDGERSAPAGQIARPRPVHSASAPAEAWDPFAVPARGETRR
ncbi:hypothetical protein NDU88_007126 [Pleurodeles waltl]|uniref:Uncharacterized protein n=1 Tax=Pleurodeles waltl TaxID=8319 RepID=A0AAV7TYZ3_PLEWA|nr:hypothetical protein NDU88_007126 [Pleurodeles waltl]